MSISRTGRPRPRKCGRNAPAAAGAGRIERAPADRLQDARRLGAEVITIPHDSSGLGFDLQQLLETIDDLLVLRAEDSFQKRATS